MVRFAVAFGCAALWSLLPVPASHAADELPPPTTARVDFTSQIRPILESRCLSCHSRGKYKGGLSLETREALLRGGEEGPSAVVGKSAESLMVQLMAGLEEGRLMPQKGKSLSREELSLMRGWIDQGIEWPKDVSFAFRQAPVAPRRPTVPAASGLVGSSNPIDRFLSADASSKALGSWPVVSDREYARRVWLDLVGLLPPADQLEAFVRDTSGDKRAQLVDRLLSDRTNYAEHWLTFWNDALRNAYRGTGFIDGGRKTITAWLFQSLYDNKPYDRFVHELVSPVPGSEGFIKGIVWRGTVNASQVPPVQAAQNVSQVFLGTNLKCASCHDSFVNHWKLTDAYALSSAFADKPLEIHRCDKPSGQISKVGFIYPELGQIDAEAPRSTRLKQLADLLVSKSNGRFARTIVNRLWAQLMGRGIVEPLDDMDQVPFNADLLDWLASDLVDHGYDLKHSLALIATSRAYQLPSVGLAEPSEMDRFEFRGPFTKRMSAEQFSDALSTLTGVWPQATGEMSKVDGRGQGGQLAALRAVRRDDSGTAARAPQPTTTPRWIWSRKDAGRDPGGTIYLRRSVQLTRVPSQAWVVATCDNEFTLWVNGSKVASGADWSKPATADVTRHLRVGSNVIAVEATNWPDTKKKRGLKAGGPNPAGFLAWVGGVEGGKLAWDAATDDSWLLSTESAPGWNRPEFATKGWSHAEVVAGADGRYGPFDLNAALAGASSKENVGSLRAALLFDDPLLAALGRTNREQVVTRRDSIATTLQALELNNGSVLDARLRDGARQWLAAGLATPDAQIDRLFAVAFGRAPTPVEREAARDLVGNRPSEAGVQDLLWSIAMLPEFQLIR